VSLYDVTGCFIRDKTPRGVPSVYSQMQARRPNPFQDKALRQGATEETGVNVGTPL